MKSPSTTSMVCGTILIVVPFIHNILNVAIVAYVLANRPERNVDLQGSLTNAYSNWCLFVGACLLAAGFIAGVRHARALQTGQPASLETQNA